MNSHFNICASALKIIIARIISIFSYCFWHFNGVITISPKSYQGWILQRVAVEAAHGAKLGGQKSLILERLFGVPRANLYFIPHYAALYLFHIYNPLVPLSKVNVLFTHFDDEKRGNRRSYPLLQKCNRIICMNSRSKEQLVKRYKCNPDRITVVIGGYDDTIYFSNDLNKTATRDVILVSRFDPRKNPLLLKQTVEQGTHLTFTLLGVNWHQSGVLDDLLALPNFRYVEDFEATDLVEMYRSHKIYLSVSANEGGPIPLLESLATGLVPVATDTGFAQDVLRGDMMKFIIPQTASASSIVKVLDEAMKFDTQLKTFTNATRQYSWERIRSKFTLE